MAPFLVYFVGGYGTLLATAAAAACKGVLAVAAVVAAQAASAVVSAFDGLPSLADSGVHD